ncbi:MAG: hypothetical protein ACRD1Z_09380 [Vicinamibacteria bacterium]
MALASNYLRARMGQAHGEAKDIPQAVPVGGFGLETRPDADLKRLYNFATLSVSIRAKAAALSRLNETLAGDPTIFAFYRSTEDGQAFLDALAAARGFFLAVTQPNIMTSIQNLVTDLEVNQFRRRGFAVRGRMPIYRNGSPELSYADTRIDPSGPTRETIDFGDLSKTKIYDDVNNLRSVAGSMDIQGMPSLGADPVTTSMIILAIVKFVLFPIIISIGLWASVSSFTTKGVSVSLPPGFEKLSPEIQRMILEGKDILEQTKDVLKWLAIAVGTAAVGGTVIYFVTK